MKWISNWKIFTLFFLLSTEVIHISRISWDFIVWSVFFSIIHRNFFFLQFKALKYSKKSFTPSSRKNDHVISKQAFFLLCSLFWRRVKTRANISCNNHQITFYIHCHVDNSVWLFQIKDIKNIFNFKFNIFFPSRKNNLTQSLMQTSVNRDC